MSAEVENRYLCEQLRLNMDAAVRLLRASARALERQDTRLARAVLEFDAAPQPGMRPLPQAARADAMVEMVVDLAMRAAELARVAWRPGAAEPAQGDVAALVEQLTEVADVAGCTGCRDLGSAPALAQTIRRTDAVAAGLLRQSEARRAALCLAS